MSDSPTSPHDLLSQHDAGQGAMAAWLPDDRRVGAVPHEEGDADALGGHAPRNAGELVGAHVGFRCEREPQGALHVHDEHEGETEAHDPGSHGDPSRHFLQTCAVLPDLPVCRALDRWGRCSTANRFGRWGMLAFPVLS